MSASSPHRNASGLAALAAVLVCSIASPALAADAPAKAAAKPAAKSPAAATTKGQKKAVVPAEPVIADASPEQTKAAELVYYGGYDCEFQQTVQIAQSAKHSAYVDVKHAKSAWLMKPVLSSTGAIRLEDVRGEALMVQIATKSMLLNTKSGQRIVDDCVCAKQRELIAEAKAAKAAAEAAPVKAAAEAATAATTTTTK